MSGEQITWRIEGMHGSPLAGRRPSRWRAEILVDGYRVEKSYHDSREEAQRWCEARAAELRKGLAR